MEKYFPNEARVIFRSRVIDSTLVTFLVPVFSLVVLVVECRL